MYRHSILYTNMRWGKKKLSIKRINISEVQTLALISCHRCTALIKHSEKCWWDDLFPFVTYEMKTLHKGGGCSDVWEHLDHSGAQEHRRGTAASQSLPTKGWAMRQPHGRQHVTSTCSVPCSGPWLISGYRCGPRGCSTAPQCICATQAYSAGMGL